VANLLDGLIGLKPLRPLQVRAMDMLRGSLGSGRKRPILQAPVGFGKTVIGAHIVAGALEKRKRVAFCVPMLNLVDQTFERFVENGISAGDMGVMQGDHPWRRPNAPVQICSIQTLGRRGFPEVDLAVVDEVHLRFKAIDSWMAELPAKMFVGLSATPWSRGLADHWDDLLIPTTIAELIEQGWLSKFRVFAPSHPDLEGVSTVAGDYHEGQLSDRMSGKQLVADVVANWCEKGESRPTLVFAVDRAHAGVLAAQFAEVGVATAYVDAFTPREERQKIAGDFQRGEVKVICSVGTMTTGVDLDIRCIVMARPTRSKALFVQCMGRGLRIAPGKENLLVFDHSDNHLRLGMVTDIHQTKLLSGKSEEREAEREAREAKPSLPRECQACTALIPPGVRECLHCGHVPAKRTDVETIEGELIEIGKERRKKNREWAVDDKAAFFGELKRYGEIQGYAPGWAARKYREKFDVWPNDPRIRDAEPRDVSVSTHGWIRSRQIAFAKSKQKFARAS
jgi:superfamily II DNA or RNA helicase